MVGIFYSRQPEALTLLHFPGGSWLPTDLLHSSAAPLPFANVTRCWTVDAASVGVAAVDASLFLCCQRVSSVAIAGIAHRREAMVLCAGFKPLA
jgi:hypothetical protein